MTTVDEALTTYSEDQLKARALAYLQAGRCPVTSWQTGAFVRTLMEEKWIPGMFDFLGPAGARAAIIKGAMPGEASGDWLTLDADQLFNIRRNFDLAGVQFAGTRTIQSLTLTCDGTHGPYPITAGAFWVKSAITGNRYVAVSSGTLNTSSTLPIAVQAEFPQDSPNGRNYSDGEGTLTVIETPLPGVSASNVAPDFSAVSATPSPAAGLGVVTVTGTRDPAPTAYDLLIIASGQVGVATFKYRINGGAWSAIQTTAASFAIPSGPTVHFANDSGGSSPSFVVGQQYGFTSPGTAITSQGIDPETDQALLDRCRERWPDLTSLPTDTDKRQTWAKKASAVVTRVKVTKDATYPGRAIVTIAGAVNPVSGGVVTAVQTYIDQREAGCDLSLVGAATVVTVTATGTVWVPRGQLALIQANASFVWARYVNSVDIEGQVKLSFLEDFLRDAGAVDVADLQLNGSPANVALTSGQVASPTDIGTTITDWREV